MKSPSRRWGAVVATLPALLLATDALAVRQPDRLDERPVETAIGRGRLFAPTSWQVPASAAKAWTRLTDTHGRRWQAVWDLDRGIPLRVFGEGIAAPGASADPVIAADAARKLLAAHLDLLAPGATVDDFTLVANLTHGRDGALRTVGFTQHHRGLPVLGGQVSFLFKRDRVIVMSSAASADLAVRVPARRATAAAARARAVAWIEAAYGARPDVIDERGAAILPILRDPADGQPTVEHRVVTTVVVDLAEPRARWEVYVDAESGAPVARRQLLAFGAGTLLYNAPVRYPAGGRRDFPAPSASVFAGGTGTLTDADGLVTFAGDGPVTVVAAATGPRVRVLNSLGSPSTRSLLLADGGVAVWDDGAISTVDAEVSAFVHANLVKAFAKAELAPDLPWLDRRIDVVVNETGRCNAYSSGDSIHFLVAGGQCDNTARLADVVYHEFGHSLHMQSLVPGAGGFDLHVSEGLSDYLAATITGDPAMGRGIFLGSSEPLRHLDPAAAEHVYPDDMHGDPHRSGLIIAGTLWDLRKDLVAALGDDAGRRKADDLYYAILRRAFEMPTAYVEALASDDDDGDLANGTPNKCVIDRAFARHGLIDAELGFGIGRPVRDGFAVSLPVAPVPGGCAAPITRAVIDWRLRGETTARQVVMTAGAGGWTGAIPPQPDGSVVEYRITATTEGGATVGYPDNHADPMYQLYVGPLVPVYCTDFEADPFAAGWTHSTEGATDDWEWGAPAGDARDPAAAASGTRVVGTDLGTAGRDGRYQPETSTRLTSPVIDVRGRSGVRLQYRRWLAVEDGFYDQASVAVDGEVVWTNLASDDEDHAVVTHADREWRLHDLDLTAAAADGEVQIEFRLDTDPGHQLGGWNIDDFCIMARGVAGCGNGVVDPGEVCDDGNAVDGDGCSAVCEPDEAPGGCCSAGGAGAPAAPVGAIGLGLVTAAVALRRRRPRATGRS